MRIVFVHPGGEQPPGADLYLFALIDGGNVVSCHRLPETALLAAESRTKKKFRMVRDGADAFVLDEIDGDVPPDVAVSGAAM